jgi:uncharacterized protein (UPF0335 family)
MINKINVVYDIDNLRITMQTTEFLRTVVCGSLDSFVEEVRRIALDIKDFSMNFKEEK